MVAANPPWSSITLKEVFKKIKQMNENFHSYMQRNDKIVEELTVAVNDATTAVHNLLGEANETKAHLDALEAWSELFDAGLVQQEDRDRHKNLRICGIQEGAETADCKSFIKTLLNEWTGIPLSDIKTDRAHRVYAGQRTGQGNSYFPRPILIRLSTFEGKEALLSKLWAPEKILCHQNKRIFIENDYSGMMRAKSAAFRAAQHLVKDQGLRFKLLYPAVLKIWGLGGPRAFRTPTEATAFLDSLKQATQ